MRRALFLVGVLATLWAGASWLLPAPHDDGPAATAAPAQASDGIPASPDGAWQGLPPQTTVPVTESVWASPELHAGLAGARRFPESASGPVARVLVPFAPHAPPHLVSAPLLI